MEALRERMSAAETELKSLDQQIEGRKAQLELELAPLRQRARKLQRDIDAIRYLLETSLEGPGS